MVFKNKTQNESHAVKDCYVANKDSNYDKTLRAFEGTGMSSSELVDIQPSTYKIEKSIQLYFQQFKREKQRNIGFNSVYNMLMKYGKKQNIQPTVQDYDPFKDKELEREEIKARNKKMI